MLHEPCHAVKYDLSLLTSWCTFTLNFIVGLVDAGRSTGATSCVLDFNALKRSTALAALYTPDKQQKHIYVYHHCPGASMNPAGCLQMLFVFEIGMNGAYGTESEAHINPANNGNVDMWA